MPVVYLNGDYIALDQARISVLDRGFLFGDGVYEVLPVYGGKPLRLDEHLARLQRSCDSIRLSNPLDRDGWAAVIGEVVARNDGGDLAVYWQITRGVGAKRDHTFPQGVAPTVFMMASPLPLPSSEQLERGITCVSMTDNRWLRCDIKAIALLSNLLLRQAAIDGGGMEAILFRDGYLTEGAASNIMLVKDGKLFAPPKDHLILPGITYDLVLELDARHGVPFEVREVAEAEVRNADELLLTSSTKEVLAITTLDGKPVGSGRPGPVFRLLHELYQQYKAKLSK